MMHNQKEKMMVVNLKDIPYDDIRNRNEKRIKLALLNFFENSDNYHIVKDLTQKDILDIYALTLNNFPARYAHTTTIIVGDPVRSEHISVAVSKIVNHIIQNPKL